MLEHQGVDVRTLSNHDAISKVLSRRRSARDQRFFAAVFLRLLSALPQEVYDLDHSDRVSVAKLLDRFPHIAKALDIDKTTQGHERLRALESAADSTDKYLAEALTSPRSLTAFEQVHQRIMRLYDNPLVTMLAAPFLPDFLSKRTIGMTLDAVRNHVTTQPRFAMTTYTTAREHLQAALEDCARYDTRYVTQFFRPFFAELLRLLEDDFESSPFNSPGFLTLTELGKKYPFSIAGAEVRLAFAVENVGAGIALDVALSIETDGSLSLHSPSQFFDQIDSGERYEPVQFSATVTDPATDSAFVHWTLEWTDGDGTRNSSDDLLALPAQPGDIPWDALKHAEPYSLEPVTRAEDLIGRSEQTRSLISKIKADSVGSFCVYGQRRVGKTSVVATLEDMPDLHGTTILYLDAGMFIVPDPRETINNLGNHICSDLLQRNPCLAELAPPRFRGALAPLYGFLTGAIRHDPTLRLVVVLDEFDALPPELYRRGSISHAFFTTLRSLSARRPVGFVLVGGERMAEILSTQGEALNKFRPPRIDYLDRQSQWSDFVDLVRKPVAPWATIADEAITKLYDETAGNPFFTKFVCTELVEDMKRRRDAYVTGTEMDRAINAAVDQAGINNFQHFWDDGVIATNDERIDQERAARRRVMLGLGEVLRSKAPATVLNITKAASRFGLTESDVQRILADFQKRKVLIRAGDEYSCKVHLFQRWLVDEGVSELDLTLVEEESLRREVEAEERRRVKDREIISLVDGWESYRGRPVTDGVVRSWLEQFETMEERRLMFELLKEIRFFSNGLIRERLKAGHRVVLRELASRGVVRRTEVGARRFTDNILISFYGGEGKRGQTYAKLYADENKIYQERIVTPNGLRGRLETLADVEGIVFVDDFIGTGRTAIRSLEEALTPLAGLVEERGVDVFVISISGFARAAEKLERQMSKVVPTFRVSLSEPLSDVDKCFSERSEVLPDRAERARAKEIAASYGRRLVKDAPVGFGNCQALVVFENTCPNNSLPILWAEGPDNSWSPLFSRP